MKKYFSRFLGSDKTDIVVVSGLPRSGTSLVMKMLDAGGLPALTDQIRRPDEDNPRGYYEYERVKKLPDGDVDWLHDACGKSVKIISALLPHLPEQFTYKVIFIDRKLEEVLISQKKMLIRRGENPDKVGDAEISKLFSDHLDQINRWFVEHEQYVSRVNVNYNQILHDALPEIDRMINFIGKKLDKNAMFGAIDTSLYRSRE